jgi:DNA-directed RNA polymerase specialized sigma24 family protein
VHRAITGTQAQLGRLWKAVAKSGDTLGGGSESFESSKGSDAVARFNEFYDFAFPRVYRYAQRRMNDEAQAQALCRMVFVRAMTSLGGIEVIEDRVRQDEAQFAFWLYCLARRTADQLCEQLAEHPELLAAGDLEGNLEDWSIDLLRGVPVMSKTRNDNRTNDEPTFESS